MCKVITVTLTGHTRAEVERQMQSWLSQNILDRIRENVSFQVEDLPVSIGLKSALLKNNILGLNQLQNFDKESLEALPYIGPERVKEVNQLLVWLKQPLIK